MTPTSASCWDVFALIGAVAFVIGALVPGFLMGGNPIAEVVEASKRDHQLSGTSSEAPTGSDGSHCESETGSHVEDAYTGAEQPLETLSRMS